MGMREEWDDYATKSGVSNFSKTSQNALKMAWCAGAIGAIVALKEGAEMDIAALHCGEMINEIQA